MSHHPNHPSHHSQHQPPSRQGVHKKWWFQAAVILMLIGMVIYVVTLDEAVGPEGQPQPAIDNMDAE